MGPQEHPVRRSKERFVTEEVLLKRKQKGHTRRDTFFPEISSIKGLVGVNCNRRNKIFRSPLRGLSKRQNLLKPTLAGSAN